MTRCRLPLVSGSAKPDEMEGNARQAASPPWHGAGASRRDAAL